MLIGYDPANGNVVKFIFTSTKYLESFERKQGRQATVNDFWPLGHGLESLHVDSFPNIDQPSMYRVNEEGNVVPV